MNILVTGATGGYGSRALEYIRQFAPETHKMGLEVNHQATEDLIAASGIPYAILRNSWYFELHEPSLLLP